MKVFTNKVCGNCPHACEIDPTLRNEIIEPPRKSCIHPDTRLTVAKRLQDGEGLSVGDVYYAVNIVPSDIKPATVAVEGVDVGGHPATFVIANDTPSLPSPFPYG